MVNARAHRSLGLISYSVFLTVVAIGICVFRVDLLFSVFLSLALFGALIGFLFFLSSRFFFSIAMSSAFILVLNQLNQLKVYFYKDRLLFQDISLLADPANFDVLLHYPVVGLAYIGFLLFALSTGFFCFRADIRLNRFGCRIIAAILAVGLTLFILQCRDDKGIKMQWESQLPRGAGVVTNLIMSSSKLNDQPPRFETPASYFLSKMRTIPVHAPKPTNKDREKPDIIVLLQESTFNPQLLKLPIPNGIAPLAMFAPDVAVKAHGVLRVSAFGGGTWLSEFSVLTGLGPDDFGARKNAVYYTVVDHLKTSLFKELKRSGYYTVVLTPFNREAYHAGHAYRSLGVDKILQPQEFGYPAALQDNLWDIPTRDMLKYVRVLLEKETSKPLFIFALTMNEHGPYDKTHADDYHLADVLKNRALAGRLSHYIRKLRDLDIATVEFSKYIEKRRRKTLFLYFGDHQPSIGWNKGYYTALKNPDYLTQFYLKNNDRNAKTSHIGAITDITFLGGLLLEHAQIPVSPFYAANIHLRHLCAGAMADCADQKLIDSYRNYIYQHLGVASK